MFRQSDMQLYRLARLKCADVISPMDYAEAALCPPDIGPSLCTALEETQSDRIQPSCKAVLNEEVATVTGIAPLAPHMDVTENLSRDVKGRLQ